MKIRVLPTMMFSSSLLLFPFFNQAMATESAAPVTATPPKKPLTEAKAVLAPLQKSDVKGVVVFVQTAKGVKIMVDASGLTPGEHGFHIHEKGDCSSPDGMSAGGHFNPSHTPHGGPSSPQHHGGDLGNLTADSKGKTQYETVSKDLTFDGPDSFVGKAIIIHADKDDFKSQPSGNAGARLACGVIKAVK